MITDVVFILATFGFFGLLVYGTGTRYRVFAITLLLLSIPPTIITLVNNVEVLCAPLTPQAHRRVVDTETGKPLAGVNVEAGWTAGEESSAGGGGGYYYSLYKTTTDSNGTFSSPSRLKALKQQVIPGFPIWQRASDR